MLYTTVRLPIHCFIVGIIILGTTFTYIAEAQNLVLPALPYAYDALEPFIDEATMRVHHTKHHQVYTDKTNGALETLRKNSSAIAKLGIDKILTKLDTIQDPKISRILRNHGGGYVNHDLFWKLMISPDQSQYIENSLIDNAIVTKYGTFQLFKDSFSQAALDIFGSGWAWLEIDLVTAIRARDAFRKSSATSASNINDELYTKILYTALNITTTQQQDTPAMTNGRVPLLALDVWEHAYYLKHQNKRADYISAWWNVINWKMVQHRLKAVLAHYNLYKDIKDIDTASESFFQVKEVSESAGADECKREL